MDQKQSRRSLFLISSLLLVTTIIILLVIVKHSINDKFNFSQEIFSSKLSLENEKSIFKSKRSPDEFLQLFEEFTKQYERLYQTQEEHQFRLQVFKENLNYIDSINNKSLSFKLGINLFADLTDEEFLQKYSNSQNQRQLESINSQFEEMQKKIRESRFKETEVDLENYGQGISEKVGDYNFIDSHLVHCPTINWVEMGQVNPILKNQQKCGSCWAHSTIAAIENLYARYNEVYGQVPSFSEQQLVDCNTFPNIGCFGGRALYAFNYSLTNGLAKSEQYPYLDRQEDCRENEFKAGFKIDDYKIYNHIRSRDLEKLVCKGVVAAPLKINKCIKHYISGIIDDSNNDCDCSSSSGPNHAVAIVGFGEDFELQDGEIKQGWIQAEGIFNTKKKCTKYWIVRNSWTDRWGEGGYMKLCRDDAELTDGTCFLRHDAVLPLMNKKYNH